MINQEKDFFQDMRLLQKTRRPLELSYSNKKVHTNGLDFYKHSKNFILGAIFWDFFGAPDPTKLF